MELLTNLSLKLDCDEELVYFAAKVTILRKRKNSIISYIWYVILVIIAVVIALYLPSVEWLYAQLSLALQIVVTTILASFIGNLIEERNWTGFMKRFTLPISRWAHLPSVSAVAVLGSFFSLITANSMLVSAYEDGRLNKLQLRVSAMCTSFMTYVYHSLRIMYPAIAAIGIVGVWYFGLLFGLGFIVVVIALFVARLNGKSKDEEQLDFEDQIHVNGSWRTSLKNVRRKTVLIAKRIILVSVPMFIFFSFLSKIGVFTLSDNLIPFEDYKAYFPSQALVVVGSMMGGIISAAAVGASFMKSGELQGAQVLLALLAGNVISLPVRSIRRSLPSAMSIFPAKEAIRIVLLNQGSRLITNIILVAVLIYLMSLGVV